jgi:hypothetical protein
MSPQTAVKTMMKSSGVTVIMSGLALCVGYAVSVSLRGRDRTLTCARWVLCHGVSCRH